MNVSEVGKVTAEQKVIMDAWLKKNWPAGHRCPICKSEHWAILEFIIDFKPYTAGLMMFGGLPSFPHIGITSECGYTMFFNAITLGVVKPQLPPPQEQPNG